jgi:hypothetical protein
MPTGRILPSVITGIFREEVASTTSKLAIVLLETSDKPKKNGFLGKYAGILGCRHCYRRAT